MLKLLNDYNLSDENFEFNSGYVDYRLTILNELVEEEYNKNVKLNKQIKSLKGQLKHVRNKNNEMLSSKSWKLTKIFRKK